MLDNSTCQISFTRLLYSLVVTNSAPNSFYDFGGENSRVHPYYDGLPVDYVASAIVAIGNSKRTAEARTFHVVNPHANDGASLDVFVKWIEEEGYRLDRSRDYQGWLVRFEAKLRALPEATRQLSSLPVLSALNSSIRTMPHVGSRNFQGAAKSELGDEAPQISRALIQKYLRDLQALQLIPGPSP